MDLLFMLEGWASLAGVLAGWIYVWREHSVGAGASWLLFLCGFASFILSIFAAARSNRWWSTVTVFAFLFLMGLARATEGCSYPCPL